MHDVDLRPIPIDEVFGCPMLVLKRGGSTPNNQPMEYVMTAFKTIKAFNTSFGGDAYRATSNGQRVNVQIQTEDSNTWRTIRTMKQSDFDRYADDVGLDSHYCNDPSLLAELANPNF